MVERVAERVQITDLDEIFTESLLEHSDCHLERDVTDTAYVREDASFILLRLRQRV